MTELPFERRFRSWCAASGVGWRELRYARPEAGGEVRALHLVPAGGATGGVMVVHGAGNDAIFSLTGLFAELLGRRLEVFTFDVDGHGRGSTTRLSERSARSLLHAALAAWGPPEGRPLHAVGISLGGSLLLHSLPALRGRLATATLISAPLRIHLDRRAIVRELGRPMLRTIWRERSRFGLTGLVPSFGPFRRGVYPLRLEETPPPGAFGYVEVLNRMLEALDLPAAARATPIPVQIIHGERDRLVPREQAEQLADLLPDGRLLVLPGETHLSTPLAPEALRRILATVTSPAGDRSLA